MTMIRLGSLFCLLAAAAASTACGSAGGTVDPEPAAEEESALAEGAPKLGESAVALPDGRLASAIGVLKGKIYVGLNNDYGHFISVDASRMTIVDNWGPRDALRLRGQEGVTVADGKLVLLGYDNDGGRGEQFAYVLTWFDPAAKKIEKTLRIVLDKDIVDPNSSFVDRPNAAFEIVGSSIHFAISHKRVSKLVKLAIPRERDSVINRDGALFRPGIDLPRASKGLAIDGNAAYVAVPKNANDGYLERIDLETGEKTQVGEKLGYPVAVSLAQGKLFVADHNGRLVVVDKSSGRTVREEDANGFVDDMTVSGDYVYLAVRGHFFVTKVRD